MLIGELSRRSGFSRDTIRYYEKLGLILCLRNVPQKCTALREYLAPNRRVEVEISGVRKP